MEWFDHEPDFILQKLVEDTAKNHRKIIDDFIRIYLAGVAWRDEDLKYFMKHMTLNEQRTKDGFKYWLSFEPKEE